MRIPIFLFSSFAALRDTAFIFSTTKACTLDTGCLFLTEFARYCISFSTTKACTLDTGCLFLTYCVLYGPSLPSFCLLLIFSTFFLSSLDTTDTKSLLFIYIGCRSRGSTPATTQEPEKVERTLKHSRQHSHNNIIILL
jgi:hypothetical protein